MAVELMTPRLRLRAWTERDAADAFAIYCDPEVTRFLGAVARMDSLEVARARVLAWIEKYARPEPLPWGCWALEVRDTGRVVGMGLLKPLPCVAPAVEIGWHLGRAHWGQGFVTEAAVAILRHGFEARGLAEIVALIDPANHRSAGVARRLGLHHVGNAARYERSDCDAWILSAEEWRERCARSGTVR